MHFSAFRLMQMQTFLQCKCAALGGSPRLQENHLGQQSQVVTRNAGCHSGDYGWLSASFEIVHISECNLHSLA